MHGFREGILSGLALGLVVGLIIGRLIWASDPPPSSAVMLAEGRAEKRAEEIVGHKRIEATDQGETLLLSLQARLARQQAELVKVVAQAETLEQILKAKEARIPFPDDLPERFSQEALRKAIGEAVADTGGEITAVDCSEYPCIVMVDLPSFESAQDVPLQQETMQHTALAPYAGDDPLFFLMGTQNEKGEPIRHAGFAFLPRASAEASEQREKILERARERSQAWLKTMGPPRETPAP